MTDDARAPAATVDGSPTQTMGAARGRYELIEEIGSGSTATVWRARDTRTGREVAVKRFHRHVLTDPVARQRIEEEVAAVSRIRHPAIVSAVDRIVGRDDLALVFPYVEGTTLAQRLASGTPMAPRDAASVALQIADALATAHEAGVVHRDVKPANILIGTDGRARLLDFGISRAFDETDSVQLTGAGMAIGTLAYMAPEQLAAAPPAPAGDVYGLGAVLYELLAGHRPYAAANPLALANAQSLPPARIEGVPAPLVDIALEAMSAQAGARPSATGLARALRGWLDGRDEAWAPTVSVVAAAPVLAAAPVVAASPLAAKPRRSTPAAALVGVGLVALLVVATIPFIAFGWGAPAVMPAPSNPPAALTSPAPSVSPTVPAAPSAPPEPPAVPPVVRGVSSNPPGRPSGGNRDKKTHDPKKNHR